MRQAGWDVTVVDADAQLIGSLADHLGYEVQIHHQGQVEKKFYDVQEALSPVSQPEAVTNAVRASTLVTTSVRHDNLPKVANVLTRAFNDKPQGSADTYIIACENVRSASTSLANSVRLPQPDSLVRHHFLNAEVDRICQTRWPHALSVKTEPYYEWLIASPETGQLPLASASFVPRIDRYFDRKRYLVNSVADAIAFLGVACGYKYLHQAASDRELVGELEPAVKDLFVYLELQYGFSTTELEVYYTTTVQRLQNKGIARTLDTVARDPERKLGPGERFVAPALALCERGVEPLGLAQLVRTIVSLYPHLSQNAWTNIWGGDAAAQRFGALVAQALPITS